VFYLIKTNCNMAALRRVVRTGLFRNSLLQTSRCVGIRNLSVDVDDNVSGVTDEQKQVGFPTILHHMVYFLVDCWQSVFLSNFSRGHEARRFG